MDGRENTSEGFQKLVISPLQLFHSGMSDPFSGSQVRRAPLLVHPWTGPITMILSSQWSATRTLFCRVHYFFTSSSHIPIPTKRDSHSRTRPCQATH